MRHHRWQALTQALGLALGESWDQTLRNTAAWWHSERPELLHQARVGWRRLRSLARLLRPRVGPAPQSPALHAFWQATGPVRELDVMLSQTLPAWEAAYVAHNPQRQAEWAVVLEQVAAARAQAAATLAAVKLARRDHWRRTKLTDLIALFRSEARRPGLDLMASETPIQPLLCGDDHAAVAMSTALEQAGWLVGAIRPPTVPEGKARLRVTLSALHTPEQVRGLVEAIASARERVALAVREAAPPPLPVFA